MDHTFTKKILHVSDLHFGRINEEVIKSLLAFVQNTQNLDLIVLTGDLTQRARSYQFVKAAEFIKNFTVPVLAVPGNHDVPLFNIYSRFFRTFNKYNTHIRPLIQDIFEDDHLIVCGINTASPFRIAEGKLKNSELQKLKKAFSNQQKFKIVACHHPPLFDEPLAPIQKEFLDLKPHFILYGHEHQSGSWFLKAFPGQFPLKIAAGTGTSTRTRNEPNSFNLITLTATTLKIEILSFDTSQFHIAKSMSYRIQNNQLNPL